LEILEALLVSMDWERAEKATRGVWRSDLLRCTHHLLLGVDMVLDGTSPGEIIQSLLIAAKILQGISALPWSTSSILKGLQQSSKILQSIEPTISSLSDRKENPEDHGISHLDRWMEITQRLWLTFMALPSDQPKDSELFDILTSRMVFISEQNWLGERYDFSRLTNWVRVETLRNLISNM
jgi:hypothetical protein